MGLSLVPITGVSAYDSVLAARLRGRILLQVQQHGEAWYVNPVDSRRYYLKDGSVAFELMRSSGLGITDADLSKISVVADAAAMNASSSACAANPFANRQKGRILLQVQQHGEAWYVDPTKCRAMYLKDGVVAYHAMRLLGLGINASDLNKIEEGRLADLGVLDVIPRPNTPTSAPAIQPAKPPCGSADVVCAQNDHALDALVVIDTSTYLQDNHRWGGFGYLSDDDVLKVMSGVQLSLSQRASVKLKLQKIIRVSFGTEITADEGYLNMVNWASAYLRTSDPPEAFIVFSKMGSGWSMGGGSQWVPAPADTAYCNEFGFWMPNSEAQRHATIALVDWDHLVGACGYNFMVFPGNERVSDKPTKGECRNNPADVCEFSPERQIYACHSINASNMSKTDPSVWRENTIIHELLHAVDIEGLGNKAHIGGSFTSYDINPKYLEEFASRLKGCPARY